jgi:hypothetical protein
MPPDLNEAAKYIAFEMFHLCYYAEVYEQCPEQRRFRSAFGERIGQAYEYSFLLHLRVLLDFFFRNPRPGYDDVWVGHFSSMPGFKTAYPKDCYLRPDGALAISRHLNKRLAHFTEVRWKEKDRHIGMESYRPYWRTILKLIDKFEAALTGTPKTEFDQRMRELRASCDHQLYIRKPSA